MEIKAATDQQIESWKRELAAIQGCDWVKRVTLRQLFARIEQERAKGQRMAEALRWIEYETGCTAAKLKARAALSGEKE